MNFIIHSYAARFDQRICAVWLFSFIQLTNGSANKPIQSYLTNDKIAHMRQTQINFTIPA